LGTTFGFLLISVVRNQTEIIIHEFPRDMPDWDSIYLSKIMPQRNYILVVRYYDGVGTTFSSSICILFSFPFKRKKRRIEKRKRHIVTHFPMFTFLFLGKEKHESRRRRNAGAS
jgi:hypothetical protein